MSRPNWRKAGQNPSSAPPAPSASRLLTNSDSSAGDYSTNPHDSTAVVFFEVCADFAKASSDVWSTDEFIQAESLKLQELRKESFEMKKEAGLKLAKTFHDNFVSSYGDVVKKNPDFFSQSQFSKLNARKKYDLASKDVQNTVWEYFRQLVQYAGMIDMYSKCPPAMLASISGVAGGLIAKLQGGDLDLNSLNPIQLGQMMIKDMNPEDLEGFGNAILEGGNIDSMMTIMQSTLSGMGGLGAMGAGLGGLGGLGGAQADLLSKMFEKM